jgi:hypothetical protein
VQHQDRAHRRVLRQLAQRRQSHLVLLQAAHDPHQRLAMDGLHGLFEADARLACDRVVEPQHFFGQAIHLFGKLIEVHHRSNLWRSQASGRRCSEIHCNQCFATCDFATCDLSGDLDIPQPVRRNQPAHLRPDWRPSRSRLRLS